MRENVEETPLDFISEEDLFKVLDNYNKIEQIVNDWNNDASHSFEDMCNINEILKE